jgi:hypothetical protein
MRIVRSAAVLLACAVAMPLSGCTQAQSEALKAEFAREAYVPALGPVHVVSVVGSAAPGGGASTLHGVGVDVAWRSLAARHFEVTGLGPSPFDVPDPNRSVQVRVRGDTTEIILR